MISSRYIEVLVVLLGSLAAIYLGSQVVSLPLPLLSLLAFFIFLIVWILSAGDFWWTPLIAGATVEGVFKIGFKVYPLELTLLVCGVALIPLILARHEKVYQRYREPLPLLFYLTALYITVRFAIDIVPAPAALRANLFRLYTDAIWPFIFGPMFHYYGRTMRAPVAVGIAYIILTIRTICSLIGYFLNIPLYILGINYVLSFSSEDSLLPLRNVAMSLLLLSIVIFHAARVVLWRMLLFPVVAAAALLVVMGGSRFSTLMVLILPVAYFTWARQWLLLGIALTGAVVVFAAVNVDPDGLYQLPPLAKRALSGLVIQNGGHAASEVTAATEASTEWHAALKVEGLRRLTLTPLTMLFGYGVRPSPELVEEKAFSEDQQLIVEMAANDGAYECAIWTVLGVLGGFGMLLYTMLFYYFWKRIYRSFMAKPKGDFWEGMIFWAGYSSLAWYATMDFQGSYPSWELVLMLIAADIVQDRKPRPIELRPEPLDKYQAPSEWSPKGLQSA